MIFDSFSEELPNANSTLNPRPQSQTDPSIGTTFVLNQETGNSNISSQSNVTQTRCSAGECTLHDVGHISHIPRTPPSQTTFTIPSIINKSMVSNNDHDEGIYGMIKLRDNDVCYTSGTIEWVGRKRSYPINSGFKVMTEHNQHVNLSKMRKLNMTFTNEIDKLKDCDCANVLPTVNAIVDHLNALHEAVDLVDLRLNTVEDAISKSNII